MMGYGSSSCLVSTPSALAARALLTVAAVSSIIGLAMSRTRRGFELKNVAAASAVTMMWNETLEGGRTIVDEEEGCRWFVVAC